MAGNQQAFSTEEFQDRLRRVQAEMSGRGIDVLLIHAPENIYYLTGHQTSGYFAYQVLMVPPEGDPRLLLRYLERGNVAEYSCLDHAETWREGDDVVAKTLDLVNGVECPVTTVGIEKGSWFLTAAVAEQLTRQLPYAMFVDATGLVDRQRLIKSEAEIGHLRRAGAVAEIEQRAAFEALAGGHHALRNAALLGDIGELELADPADRFRRHVADGRRPFG